MLPWLRPDDQRARAAMVAVMIALMWRYMLWRWFATLPSAGLTFDFAVGVIFVLIETLMILGSTVSLVFLIALSDRTADADRNVAWLESLRPVPLVDVFICTYNEEEAILERTIVGALSMEYPRLPGMGARRWAQAVAR